MNSTCSNNQSAFHCWKIKTAIDSHCRLKVISICNEDNQCTYKYWTGVSALQCFAHIFMHSSGQQGSGPEGADVSDSSAPTPPPFEKVRDFDLWPGKGGCEEDGGRAKNDHKDRMRRIVCTSKQPP